MGLGFSRLLLVTHLLKDKRMGLLTEDKEWKRKDHHWPRERKPNHIRLTETRTEKKREQVVVGLSRPVVVLLLFFLHFLL